MPNNFRLYLEHLNMVSTMNFKYQGECQFILKKQAIGPVGYRLSALTSLLWRDFKVFVVYSDLSHVHTIQRQSVAWVMVYFLDLLTVTMVVLQTLVFFLNLPATT